MAKKRIAALLLVLIMVFTSSALASFNDEEAKKSVARVYVQYSISNNRITRITRNDVESLLPGNENSMLRSEFVSCLTKIPQDFIPVEIVAGQNGEYGMRCIYSAYLSSSWTGTAYAIGHAGSKVQYFLTNEHVISKDIELPLFFFDLDGDIKEDNYVFPIQAHSEEISYYIIFDEFGSKKAANPIPVKSPIGADIAVLALPEPTDLRKPVKLRSYKSLDFTDQYYAIGFGGIDNFFKVTNLEIEYLSSFSAMSVVKGSIRKITPREQSTGGEMLEADINWNNGHSGSPVFDSNGYVVGTATCTAIEGKNTIKGAISVHEAIALLDAAGIKDYDVVQDSQPVLSSIWLYIGAGVVVLALVLILLLTKNNKKSKKKSKSGDNAGQESRYLVGVTGALAGMRYQLQGTMYIGRDPSTCQIVYPRETGGVSGKHCTIRYDGTSVRVTDTSSGGTWINEQRLTPGTPATLHRGQTLLLGSSQQVMKLTGK